jgi:hypothetical protein
LIEQTVNFKIDEAYDKLKTVLTENGCKVLTENKPIQLQVSQGSLWGIAPRTAKKNIITNFEEAGESTKIRVSSSLAEDWKNVTIIGCVLAVMLTSVVVWMATDLSTFAVTGTPSVWSWIVTSGEIVHFEAVEAFINLAWGLAIFLVVIIILEVFVVVYAAKKIDTYTKEALKKIS